MESIDTIWIAAAALLLVLALAVAVARAGRRKRAAPPAPPQLTPEDELRSLGISDIRPRPRREAQPAAAAPEPAPAEPETAFAPRPAEAAAAEAAMADTAPEPEPPALDDEPDADAAAEAATAEAAAPADPPRALAPTEPFWGSRSPRAITELLRSLWTAADAQTVALYHPGAAPGEYVLAHASSHSPAVRHEGHFHEDPFFGTIADALEGADEGANVTLGGEMLREMPLPHYEGRPRVGEAIVQPVAVADVGGVLVVVDRGHEGPAFGEAEHRLVRRYAGLVAELMDDLRAGLHSEAPPEGAPAAEPEAHAEPVARASRPTRRGIITDEMERARAEGHPLALALVARADGEALHADGPEAIREAEAALERHLRGARRTRRVELFGDLQYGVFLYERLDEVRRWADGLRKPDRGGEAPPPLCIGVALLGERHNDAADLREEATQALIRSYREDGELVVFEGGQTVVH